MASDKNHMRAVVRGAAASGEARVRVISITESAGMVIDDIEPGARPGVPVVKVVRPGHRLAARLRPGRTAHPRHGFVREYGERTVASLALIPLLRDLKRRGQVDVVHFFDNLGPGAGLAARSAGVPAVVTMLARTAGGGQFARSLLWRLSFLTVDAVIASNDVLADELRANGAPVRAVIPIAADGAAEQLAASDRDLVVWTGRLQGMGEAELQVAAPAMAAAMAATPGMRAEVWPKPEFAEQYGPLARQAGLRVRVPGAQFHGLLGRIRVLVSPVRDPQSVVGPPLTWIEAAASGVVVVTTPCRGIPEQDMAARRVVVASSFSEESIQTAIAEAWTLAPQLSEPDQSSSTAGIVASHLDLWRELT